MATETTPACTVRVGDDLEGFGVVQRIDGLNGRPFELDASGAVVAAEHLESLLVFICKHPASDDEQRARFGPTRLVNVSRKR